MGLPKKGKDTHWRRGGCRKGNENGYYRIVKRLTTGDHYEKPSLTNVTPFYSSS